MRFHLVITEKHLPQGLGLVGAQYIVTIINKSITMIIVSLSGFLLYSFSEPHMATWKKP